MNSEIFKLDQIILNWTALNGTLHDCFVKNLSCKAVNFGISASRLALWTLITSFQVIVEAVLADDRGALVLVGCALAELWIVHSLVADEAFEVFRHFTVFVDKIANYLSAHSFGDGKSFL